MVTHQCAYCTSTKTLLCHDCQQSYCHNFLGTISSHIVFHLNKSGHRKVGQKEFQWFKCTCGESDVFRLGVERKTTDSIQDDLINNNSRQNYLFENSISGKTITCEKCNPNLTKLIQNLSFSHLLQEESESEESSEQTIYGKISSSIMPDSFFGLSSADDVLTKNTLNQNNTINESKILNDKNTTLSNQNVLKSIVENNIFNSTITTRKNIRVFKFQDEATYILRLQQMLKKENKIERLIREQLSQSNVPVRIKGKTVCLINEVRVGIGDEVRIEILTEKNDSENNKIEEPIIRPSVIIKAFIINDTFSQTIAETSSIYGIKKKRKERISDSNKMDENSKNKSDINLNSNLDENINGLYHANLSFPYRNIGYTRMKKAINTFIKKTDDQMKNLILWGGDGNEQFKSIRERYSHKSKEETVKKNIENLNSTEIKDKPYEQVIKELLMGRKNSDTEDFNNNIASLDNSTIEISDLNNSNVDDKDRKLKMYQPKNLHPLNTSQLTAIDQTFKQRVTLVQGPPGTGKTVTSVAVIYNHYYRHSQVISPDNQFFSESQKNYDSIQSNYRITVRKGSKETEPSLHNFIFTPFHTVKQLLTLVRNVTRARVKESKFLVVAPSNIAVDNLSRNMVKVFGIEQSINQNTKNLDSLKKDCKGSPTNQLKNVITHSNTDSSVSTITSGSQFSTNNYQGSSLTYKIDEDSQYENKKFNMNRDSSRDSDKDGEKDSELFIPSYFAEKNPLILRIVSRNRETLVSDLDHFTLHTIVKKILCEIEFFRGVEKKKKETKNEKKNDGNGKRDRIVEWMSLCEVYHGLYQSSSEIGEKYRSSQNINNIISNDIISNNDLFKNQISEVKSELKNRIAYLFNRYVLPVQSETLTISLRYFLIASHPIIISTLVTAGLPLLSSFTFHTVLLDEAVQATEPMSLIPMGYRPGRVILVGDHKQLGPTILSCKRGLNNLDLKNKTQDADNIDKISNINITNSNMKRISNIDILSLPDSTVSTFPLKTSLFERLLRIRHVPALLSVQYRMDPILCEFVNEAFYGGKLRSFESTNGAEITNSENNHRNITLPKTFFYNCAFPEEQQNSSFMNRKEGDIILKIVKYLRNKGVRNQEIGIITPYEAQRNYLQGVINGQYRGVQSTDNFEKVINEPHSNFNNSEKINNSNVDSSVSDILINDEIEIANVDAFQGREKVYIIISLVRSNESNDIGFLKNRRRMNVALTRSKNGCWIVGNVKTYYYGRIHSIKDNLSQNINQDLTVDNFNIKNLNINDDSLTESDTKNIDKHNQKNTDNPQDHRKNPFTMWQKLIKWYMKRDLLVEGEIENLKSMKGEKINFEEIVRKGRGRK